MNGYILIARKILDSGIFSKPPLYFKLWLWILMQARFKDHGNLKRGQFFTTIEDMREAMSYKIGYRKIVPSRKEIRGAYESLTKGHMIGTTKGTRGMVITILNYDKYQNIKNYEGHDEGHTEGQVEGTLKKKERERKKKEGRKRIATPPPTDFEISDNLKAWCKKENFTGDLTKTIETCFDHFRSKGEKRADWEATIRTWIRNKMEWGKDEDKSKQTKSYRPKTVQL